MRAINVEYRECRQQPPKMNVLARVAVLTKAEPELLAIPVDSIVEHVLLALQIPQGIDHFVSQCYPRPFFNLISRAKSVASMSLPTAEQYIKIVSTRAAGDHENSSVTFFAILDQVHASDLTSPLFEFRGSFVRVCVVFHSSPFQGDNGAMDYPTDMPSLRYKVKAIIASELYFNFMATVLIQESQRNANNSARRDEQECTEMHRCVSCLCQRV